MRSDPHIRPPPGEIWAMSSLGIYVRFDNDNVKPGEATSTRLVWPSELLLVVKST